MIILGIETSCDETAAAVVDVTRQRVVVLSNVINSQIRIHKRYGGIVPEVAAREHVKNIIPIIARSLAKTNVAKEEIGLIAVTRGSGLVTSLMVGLEAAKALAFALNKPIVDVNHMAGHAFSWFLPRSAKAEKAKVRDITFPFLSLLVSGGHTELVLVKGFGRYKVLGKTLDDASGEAFDKVAKMLNLGFPGGPAIARAAEKGNASAFSLPRPMIHSGDLNFSFAGLKTAVLYADKRHIMKTEKYRADMAASFQEAVVELLVEKTVRAAKKYKVKQIAVAGGVSANKRLKQIMKKRIQDDFSDMKLFFPLPEYTGDNAAMIALAGYMKYEEARSIIRTPKTFESRDYMKWQADPNMRLAD